MRDFVIFSDSTCDIPSALLAEWGVRQYPITFMLDGDDTIYKEEDFPSHEFYELLRQGRTATTSAGNVESYRLLFAEAAEAGKDILHLAFSSGLSSTCRNARLAAEEIEEEYSGCRAIVIDSLSASAGQGLLLWLMVQKKASGASLAETAAYAEEMKLRICHWFTVDSLSYLARGGRISAVTALAGNALGIRPILHMDDEGHLVSVSRARGRKAMLSALLDAYGREAAEIGKGPIFFNQADCPEDAEKLKAMFAEKYNVPIDLIVDLGTVIGAHCGAGTMSVFFVGNKR